MRAPVKLSRRLFVFALLASGLPSVADDEPIHCLIDAKLRSAPGVESPQSSDAEFLRGIGFCLALLIGLGIDVAFCWLVCQLFS